MLEIIDFIFAGAVSLLVGLFVTPVVIGIARKLGIMDRPNDARKIHHKPTPLLGGLAVFLTLTIVIGLYYFLGKEVLFKHWSEKHLLGMMLGALIIMIGGFFDDKYNISAKKQLVAPILAIITVIISGIGIDWLTNPLTGDILRLDSFKLTVLWFEGLPYKITWLADIFTVLWLLAMMYTTKLNDGVDGFVSGISIIAGLFIFVTALLAGNRQDDIALIAIIFVGSMLAFLLFNFNPAKIFLGEGGSLLAGFILGVLSIISGSKVAVTLLVMGIPLLDVVWTIIRRLLAGKNPFTASDKKHLHHRLLDSGLSTKKTVLILYGFSIFLGAAALGMQYYNLNAMVAVVAVLSLFGGIYSFLGKSGKLDKI